MGHPTPHLCSSFLRTYRRTFPRCGILCGFVHLFPAWSVIKTQQDHTSSLTLRGWRPHGASNQERASACAVQSERRECPGGGASAAPERDAEVVQERRRLVGHERHSLRVLIIWRGVCSARPRSPFQVEIQEELWPNLNWDDWLNPVQDRWNSQQAPIPAEATAQDRCRF